MAALEARDDLQVLWKLVKHGNVRAPDMSRWEERIKLRHRRAGLLCEWTVVPSNTPTYWISVYADA
jgi:hypothetical protein